MPGLRASLGRMHWGDIAERAEKRHRDGLERLPRDPDGRQKQLTRVANAAWAVGLARLAEGRREEAETWLREAASRYRESFADAPPGSWGRLLGTLKSRLLARDFEAAVDDARWALAQGPATADSPIGRYAAVLALLVLGDDEQANTIAVTLRGEPDDRFPRPVSDALVGLASHDSVGYAKALRRALASFEARPVEAFLEEVPVADTVAVLDTLARQRGLAVEPTSRVLPSF